MIVLLRRSGPHLVEVRSLTTRSSEVDLYAFRRSTILGSSQNLEGVSDSLTSGLLNFVEEDDVSGTTHDTVSIQTSGFNPQMVSARELLEVQGVVGSSRLIQ